MPRYKKDMDILINQHDVLKMFERAACGEHIICISLLYITGARPSEIIELKKRDFEIRENDLLITLITKKLRKPMKRIIPFDIKETPFVEKIIIPYILSLEDDDELLFSFHTTRRIEQIIEDTSEGRFCPYNFRKNRLSRLGMSGASAHELMYFKGAIGLRSISPYLYRNPAVLDRLKDRHK